MGCFQGKCFTQSDVDQKDEKRLREKTSGRFSRKGGSGVQITEEKPKSPQYDSSGYNVGGPCDCDGAQNKGSCCSDAECPCESAVPFTQTTNAQKTPFQSPAPKSPDESQVHLTEIELLRQEVSSLKTNLRQLKSFLVSTTEELQETNKLLVSVQESSKIIANETHSLFQKPVESGKSDAMSDSALLARIAILKTVVSEEKLQPVFISYALGCSMEQVNRILSLKS